MNYYMIDSGSLNIANNVVSGPPDQNLAELYKEFRKTDFKVYEGVSNCSNFAHWLEQNKGFEVIPFDDVIYVK